MRHHTGRLIPALLVGALLVFGQGGMTAAASPTSPQATAAQTPSTSGTLNVSPPLISVAVAPGGKGTAELTLHAAVAENVTIEADGLGQGLDGSFHALAAADDKSPFSARSMTTFGPQTFQMAAGGSQTVTVTVTVPADAGEGTRYAILNITGTPVSSENVGIGVQVGVSSLITIASTRQIHTGEIRDVAVGKIVPGQPLAVTGTLVNTGNSHFGAAPNQVNASATLWNSSGEQVATSKAVLTGNSIVPTFGRQFALSLKSPQMLADGAYHLTVDAVLQDGTAVGDAGLDFTVAGGAVAGATGAPAQAPTGSGGSDGSGLLLIGGLLVGAALGAVIVGVFSVRNRRRQGPRTSS